jgi:hypothetical protein
MRDLWQIRVAYQIARIAEPLVAFFTGIGLGPRMRPFMDIKGLQEKWRKFGSKKSSIYLLGDQGLATLQTDKTL